MNKVYVSSYIAPSGNTPLRFAPIAAAVLLDRALLTTFAATEAGGSAELAELMAIDLLCERQNFGPFRAYTDSSSLSDGWGSWREGKLPNRKHADVWKPIDARAREWLVIQLVPHDDELIIEAKKQAALLIARGFPRDVAIAFADDIMRSQGRVML